MLTILIGTDWVANRNAILGMLAEDVANERPGRVLMVPELISHDTERRLSMATGDTCSRFAEVLSFSRLASRVADSVGHSALECLDNGGRVVAMAAAVRQLHSRLKAYASMETRPEFLIELVDAVDEFKRCNIRSQDLLEASRNTEGSLAQKLEELSLILESYDALCQRGKRDPRDQMTWLLEELEEGSYGQEHVFYIDGFPDFTRQHMAIILHLISVSENVTVALTCDKPASTAVAYEKPGQTAAELIRHAKAMGVAVEIRMIPARQDALDKVRSNLLQGNIEATTQPLPLRVYRTDTVYRECALAMETVFSLVQAGARYRDVAIVCPDMGLYEDTMQMIFRRSGIPLYISGTEDVLEKSVLTTVLAAMDTVLGGFDQQDVFHYLKSALSPLDPDNCDRMENYAIIWGVTGKQWLSTWENHPDGLDGKDTESARLRLEKLNEQRSLVMEPLQTLHKGLTSATTVKQQVLALYTYLEDISMGSRLKELAQRLDQAGDNRSAQILNQLWDILVTALEQLYDVLGETAWDPDNFTRLFKLLLSQYDVGTIPPVLDAVSMGPVSAMRCQQCKHLIVLGAAEGAMPGYGGTTGVLTDQERTALRDIGVPLTGGALEGLQTEFAEIYGVFCGAEETVTISCPASQPALVHSRLEKIAGGLTPVPEMLGAALADPEEAAAYLVRREAASGADLLALTEAYNRMYSCKNYNFGSVSRENINGIYGQTLQLSASQIDKQAQCKMGYFLRYGLRAKERKAATVDPAEFGTYVHAVLENTAREVMEQGGFRAVSMERILQIATRYSEEYAKDRFAQIDSQRFRYLLGRNSRELEMIVRELWEEMQQCDFAPVGFEVGFGDEREVPAIDVSGRTMTAQLRGFVDRVDAWQCDGRRYFRVVDYKTGKKDFDYCDVFNGYGLQMLLYLFALEDGGGKLLGEEPIPAGVQYFPARVPLVSADGVMTPEEADEARVKMWKRKGLLLSFTHVLQAMEHSEPPKRLPYTTRKDGTLTGDLADRRQISMLKTYVFHLVSSMVDDIASGMVAPNPYSRGTSHDACAYCPYGAVCHKQDVENRRNYKAVTAQKFWEDVEREVTHHGK